MPDYVNDNPSPMPDEPDAHGQAALLLAESILHCLVETEHVTPTGAIAVVTRACEVKVDVAEAAGESEQRMRASLALLRRISLSFASDAMVG